MPNVPGGIFRALAARQGEPRPNHSQTDSQGMARAWKRSWSSRSRVATRAVDAPDLTWNPTFGNSLEFSSRSLPCSVLGGARTRECQSAPDGVPGSTPDRFATIRTGAGAIEAAVAGSVDLLIGTCGNPYIYRGKTGRHRGRGMLPSGGANRVGAVSARAAHAR
jgi:hypothetical protein